ncbi:acyl transferase/acyl hydrolase/lysophospholipase [Crassisporium funariophilum]|nr:acyl transferase/acyl hydrolase/lysophospholipase [Crassisporium funariophilum]
MSVQEIARSSAQCRVEASSDAVVSQIWFKTDPIDRSFAYRAVQLQLQTDSCDQGHSETVVAGNWSWFELVIFKDIHATEPQKKDGKELAWRSHGNRTDPLDQKDTVSRHFGIVIDRRQDLLDALELGNVIGVRVCAKFPGWINDAREDIFTPMSWTLSSKDTPDDIPESIQDGVYSLTPTSSCHVKSTNDEQVHAIWFSTPVLDADVVNKIEDVQLFTYAHHEGTPAGDAVGIWCWFDLIILDSLESVEPKVKDGRALVWRSHDVPRDAGEDSEQIGKILGGPDLLGLLEVLQPGNVIAVRACARFPGWEMHAHSARLVVRISNKGRRRAPPKPVADWKEILRSNQKLQARLEEYLNAVTPEGVAAAVSVETTLLAQELRTDRQYGVGGKPLRLLSLDGGGVRGISSLHVLKAIMSKVAGDPNAKPCDYFDMMAGTSTGGLIAIMLGRLRMTVDQCIEAYEKLASKIFNAGIMSKIENGSVTGARYSATVLEQAIKDIVKQYTGNADEPMRDPQDECKVFVLACRADDLSNRVATHLRTYTNKNVEKSFADYTIWQAARATSAAPTYFPRIKLDDYEYVDGGLGFNNPVLLLMGEARLHFGFARPIGCLVTVGTGMEPNVSLPPEGTNVFNSVTSTAGILASMWALATKAEHANQMAAPLCEKGTYYRFNLGEKIAEKRWVERVDPPLWQRWFGTEPHDVEHFTPENWAQVTIDMADYEHMADFVRLTQRYIETEEKDIELSAGKLPPKRLRSSP